MPKHRRKRVIPSAGGITEFCATENILTNTTKLTSVDLAARENPSSLKETFKAARMWYEKNFILEQIVRLNVSFFNFGLRLRPLETREKDPLKEWMKDVQNRAMLLRFVSETIEEWHLADNVISMWVDPDVTPFLLPPESCDYKDKMGVERLRAHLGINENDLKDADFSKEQIRRYTSSTELLIGEGPGEAFAVATRGRKGTGLCKPRMVSIFPILSQCDSMQAGELTLAHAGRQVIRQHHIGFEVRSNNNANQANFLYKQTRAKKILEVMGGKMGLNELVSQFDHKIGYVWIDPKLYDTKKWATIVDRLVWWGGPVAFMLLAKTVAPFLLSMLKVRIEYDRKNFIGPFLERVLNSGAFPGLPPVSVQWSNRCFYDLRLAWDMVKFLTQQGPLSLGSALAEADFEPDEEAERKRAEAASNMDEALLPKFDPNHGKRPGKPEQTRGRTPGIRDGEGSS